MNPVLALLLRTLERSTQPLNEAEQSYLAWLRRLRAQARAEHA